MDYRHKRSVFDCYGAMFLPFCEWVVNAIYINASGFMLFCIVGGVNVQRRLTMSPQRQWRLLASEHGLKHFTILKCFANVSWGKEMHVCQASKDTHNGFCWETLNANINLSPQGIFNYKSCILNCWPSVSWYANFESWMPNSTALAEWVIIK